MTELVRLLATLLGLAISVFGAYWVWQDAQRLRRNGAYITPSLWAVLVFSILLVSLPIYLYLRRTTWRTFMSPPLTTEVAAQDASQCQFSRPSKAEFRAFYWVASIIFAVMLSMYATWVAISRFPVPDSDAINLGLFLFFLIGLLDFLLMGDLIVTGLREGKHIATGMLAVIFVEIFLIAAAVGLLTWGIGWLIVDRPWVPRVFYIAVVTLWIMSWWLQRKSRVPPK